MKDPLRIESSSPTYSIVVIKSIQSCNIPGKWIVSKYIRIMYSDEETGKNEKKLLLSQIKAKASSKYLLLSTIVILLWIL